MRAVHDYARQFVPSTVDHLAQVSLEAQEPDAADKPTKSDEKFAEHLLLSAIQRGIKNGKLHQGVYHASR